MVSLEWYAEAALPLTHGPLDHLQNQQYLIYQTRVSKGFPESQGFEVEDKDFSHGPEPQDTSCK